jgi:50S ribosomal protein L16 3-hydroxylase
LPGARLDGLYRDPGQSASTRPAELPDALIEATLGTLNALRFDAALAARFLGCWLSEPNTLSIFTPAGDAPDLEEEWPAHGALVLDRRSRMLYRDRQIFINGETAPVAPSPALRALADERRLDCADPRCRKLSEDGRACLADWLSAGWLHYVAA